MRSNVKNEKSLCGTSYMLTIDTTVVRIIVSKLYLLLVVVGVTLQLTAHLHNRTTADEDG